MASGQVTDHRSGVPSLQIPESSEAIVSQAPNHSLTGTTLTMTNSVTT